MATPWHAAIQTIANSDAIVHCIDRRLGPQQQDVQAQVGDFVRQRALGLPTPLYLHTPLVRGCGGFRCQCLKIFC